MPDRLRVLICANPDLNYIDGSSIWSQTITLAIAETGLASVDFLARSRPERDELFKPLNQHADIRVIDGPGELNTGGSVTRLRPEDMVTVAEKLDRQHQYDLVVVRGKAIALGIANAPGLYAKCWIYLTDIAQRAHEYSPQKLHKMGQLAHGCHRILCQSQGFIRLWKSLVPGISDDKFLLYTPVVPDPVSTVHPIAQRSETVIYAGKFAPDWMTLEMTECWSEIQKRHPLATLRMVGDKFHQDGSGFHVRMRSVLNESPGVDWRGAMSRDQVQEELLQAKIGLSWRSDRLNDTLEYSTKILEYGMAGCAAVLNRNPLHEEMLGEDYPLFANSRGDFIQAVDLGLADDGLVQAAANRLQALAFNHSFSTRAEQLRSWLGQVGRAQISVKSNLSTKRRVLVAGHDLKFFMPLKANLEKTGRFEFLIDQWLGHNTHDEALSRKMLDKADVIVCEWCLGNLKWYSHNRKPDQLLIARFHLQERALPYLAESRWCNIDKIVYVSEFISREGQRVFGFPIKRTQVIANLLDHSKFNQLKKTSDAKYTLGMIGSVPSRKRLDRAVDLLEQLNKKDSRYQLRIKGRYPFDYEWLVKRPDEREYYRKLFERINTDPLLAHRVIFDPPGDDVNQWLSMIGYILSPSDFESFHMAIGEGILTGTQPVIWPWDGAEEIWGGRYVVKNIEDATSRIFDGISSPMRLPVHLSPQLIIESWSKLLSTEQNIRIDTEFNHA